MMEISLNMKLNYINYVINEKPSEKKGLLNAESFHKTFMYFVNIKEKVL